MFNVDAVKLFFVFIVFPQPLAIFEKFANNVRCELMKPINAHKKVFQLEDLFLYKSVSLS